MPNTVMSMAEVMNRRIERADIAMLEVLEKAPKHQLRWEDRMESVRVPPKYPGGEPTAKTQIVQGLQSQVDAFCDDRPDLTTIILKEEEALVRGQLQKFTPAPYRQRASIARLESMVGGGLIIHTGQADEQSAAQPTRTLQLSEAGEMMLTAWRENQLANLPYPDPEMPKPERKERKDKEQTGAQV